MLRNTNAAAMTSQSSGCPWEAILEALPVEEQVRWYEIFQEARRRAEAGDFSQSPIGTTVTSGTEHRNGVVEVDDQ